jgi:hypothetical protein
LEALDGWKLSWKSVFAYYFSEKLQYVTGINPTAKLLTHEQQIERKNIGQGEKEVDKATVEYIEGN